MNLHEMLNHRVVRSQRMDQANKIKSLWITPESSLVGILVSAMAVLAFVKRRIAARIGSGALRGDAASSLTCGYMAGAVLLGLLLNAALHWWWAEDIAGLVFLIFLIQETREAFEEAHEGKDDD